MAKHIQEKDTLTQRRMGRGLPLYDDEPVILADVFLHALRKHQRPDALNFKRDGEWQHLSSEEIARRAGRIAAGLHGLGMRKGDRVAILAANSPEWTLADAGCQFAGLVDVPIYTTLAPQAVEYIINDSGARTLFVDNADSLDRVRPKIENCPELRHVILFDGNGPEIEGTEHLSALEKSGEDMAADHPELIEDLREAVLPSDVATLIYTSGTTGEPKGVMLTHANIISNVIDSGEKYSFSEKDLPLSVLPLSHVFERSAMYLYILNGMAVHYAESIEKVPDNLREVSPTIFVGVPRIFEKVYAKAKLNAAQAGGSKEKIFDWAIKIAADYALRNERRQAIPYMLAVKHSIADKLVYRKLRQFFGGRLRCCITGGAALSDDIYLIFTGSGIAIMQGYGLTETSPVITSSNELDVRLGTVGKPIRNVKVRIAADGEIEATGPGVMLGYYKKEQATLETFTEDGWFKTGDIGELDGDGFLRITDRKKELFKTSGGKYIAPSPIEGMIRSSRFVSQAVLIGNERKFPAALIVPNFEMLRSYAKLKGLKLTTPAEFCSSPQINDLIERQIDSHTGELGQYEKIKKFALLENDLTVEGGELTPTLKVKRRVVDEKYREVIERIYSGTD